MLPVISTTSALILTLDYKSDLTSIVVLLESVAGKRLMLDAGCSMLDNPRTIYRGIDKYPVSRNQYQGSASKGLSGDNRLMYFRGAFIDSECPYVTIKRFDHIAAHNTMSAVELHSRIDDALGGFGCKKLCH